MPMLNILVAIPWLAFIVYWTLAARATKKTVRRDTSWRVTMGFRVAFIVVAVLLFQLPFFNHLARSVENAFGHNLFIAGVGTALVYIGVGFTFWARASIGTNWGMPMSVKENPELVTSGPYAYVRHPIYAGLFLALIGSVLVQPLWLFPFPFAFAYFFYSAKTEEKLLLKTFPNQYPEYMKRTKMLVPFVF